ncbi:hypothetical protein MATL_G00152590 [Megalops atlanticus]|uniref:Uncharacterized protein n=1 Tax=Megalops atlanticus TaxID=7932 RepID=A0A9D3PWW4_MEGAT|nr:hypothetical protein MATL_G00152590 [Megalops atlanticus]
MDVSVSVSLMRDQLGTVIEQAVAAAVDTVLGEMVKVVRSKLEEFSKEITAKEKENESMKQMLEVSRCQMKTLRKYLSAVVAKDERHVFANQRKLGTQSEPNCTFCLSVGELQHSPDLKRRGKVGDGSFILNGKAQRLLTENRSACRSECLSRAVISWDGSATSAHDLDQEPVARESKDSFGPCHSIEREGLVTRIKEEHRDPAEGHDGYHRRETGAAPNWGTKQRTPSNGQHTETPISDPTIKTDVAANISALAAGGSLLQVKKEEGEIEVVCIKEEPAEVEAHSLSSRQPDPWGGANQAGPTGTTRPEEPADMSLAATPSSTPPDAEEQRPLSGAQRQARWRQRLREAGLAKEHQQRRAELKREREKSLPGPLQAALERERREKTRIRVARWRAKRKLQATQPEGPDSRPAAAAAPRCHQLRGAAPRFSGPPYGGPCCNSAAPFPPLQRGSNPLLPGLGQDGTDTLLQPGVTPSTQQGILGADSELFR